MYPIDYCVIILKDIRPFVELHFRSFRTKKGFDSFSSFHIVNKDTKDGAVEFCKGFIPSVHIHNLDFYHPENRLGNVVNSDWQWDLAYSYNYAIENCGNSEWILIIHPDTLFHDSNAFFEGLWNMITPSVGAIWDGGTVLLRRKAYEQCHFGLWPLFGVVFAKYKGNDNGLIMSMKDSRAKNGQFEKFHPIEGIEAWEICAMELQLLEWDVITIPYEIASYKEHTAHCTGHDIEDLSKSKVYQDKMKLVHSRLKGYN
ncbi:MAG: hypothetical protein WC346_15710 [Methanogenium sp.]|jgi:hypothetical protein